MPTLSASKTHYVSYWFNISQTKLFHGFCYIGSESISASMYGRSLVWFDGASIASALVDKVVTAVGINATYVSDDGYTSPYTHKVRIYRTDLTYDASKAGKNSAGTVYFANDATMSNPYNDHLLAYGETTNNSTQPGTVENDVFMTGDAAVAFVESVISGCAMCLFVPVPENYASNYRFALMSDVGLAITYEDKPDTTVKAPTTAAVQNPIVTQGNNGSVAYSGAQDGSSANTITGYLVRYADSADGVAYGAWSSAITIAETAHEGTLSVPVAELAKTRKYQIASVGVTDTSAYVDVLGDITTISAPLAPSVTFSARYCRVSLTVTAAASYLRETQFVRMTVDQGAAQIVGTIPYAGGSTLVNIVLTPGAHDIGVLIVDSLGNAGAETALSVTLSALDAGNHYLSFRGVSSADLGLLLTTYPLPDGAGERTKNEISVAVSGDAATTEGDDISNAYDRTAVFYAETIEDARAAREWLHGEGALITGDDPEYYQQARCDTALALTRFSIGSGGFTITASFHVQPYRARLSDKADAVTLNRAGTIYNPGSVISYPLIKVYGTGNITLTLSGVSITLIGVDTLNTIDAQKRIVLNQSGASISTFSGEFPPLNPGASDVSWSGDVTKISINRRVMYR